MQNYLRDREELLRDAYIHVMALLGGIELLKREARTCGSFLSAFGLENEEKILEDMQVQAQELKESIFFALELRKRG